MSRVLGTETEYGISTPSNPALSPIVTSTHAVVAYAALHTGARSRWDFREEHPLRDSRGFDLKRYHTVPVVDPNALGVANVVTANGARFYVDHAHPEYSSPECTNAWDAMLYDAAGDLILRRAGEAVASLTAQGTSVLATHDTCPPLKFYKNNVDGKGASYGSHENYQYSRETDFEEIAQGLIPFFVARQVVTGAGRMGLGADGEEPGFQISQRADYIEQEISLETTLNRGIINTRDEPHAVAEDFGRLHVIIGDATMSHTSTLLKLGMTSLVLDAIESGVDFSDLRLAEPVEEVQRVSRDLTLTHQLALRDGRRLTALDILAAYRERVTAASEADEKVLAAWDEVVALLADNPLKAAHLLDWVAKYRLIKGYLDRGVAADDPKLALIDLQYTDIDPAKSLYHALVRKGQMRSLVSEEEIAAAAETPPADTRAYLRGHATRKFGEEVLAASWQSLTFRIGEAEGANSGTACVALDDTKRLGQDEVGALLESADSAADFVNSLRQLGVRIEYPTLY
ncbi:MULTISPECIES: depupylase/deamidase Dop [unclassified Corynebacterium]|uniref:depupylase/deamidase Dop n=1 Tax=unclassified Corynebacterium TaxID=2624378 RepID=UPI0008A10730|nr:MULTISPECIES: depupylase/deamidase Dop [unclassified Corynebacterium]OFN76353.1 proteasome accessory factor PafA2 [Corynebacterium sp. HMSC074E01]OFP67047.1 proteasome accessory factor PafA2 [Corynebacterium sp. HMSC074C01]